MKLLRILNTGTCCNIRNASKLYKKKPRAKISLSPKFLDTVKQWPKLLEAEKREQYQNLDEMIKAGTDWRIIEDRGHCKGNLSVKRTFVDPFQGFIAVLEGVGFAKSSKWMKTGTPVALSKVTKDGSLEAISEGHIISVTGGLLKMCVYHFKHFTDHSGNFLLMPSSNSGTIHYIQKLISEPESLSSDSVHLVNLAYRSITMPSIHDPQTRNLPDTLNKSQQAAVSAALNAKRNLLCIQGPPGTGKTRVIAEIVHHLIKKRKKVLVCAPTHVAVRNAMSATTKRMEEEVAAETIAKQIHLLNNERDNLQQQPRYSEVERIHKLLAGLPKDDTRYPALAAESYKIRTAILKEIFAPVRVVFTTLGTSAIQKLPQNGWKADVMLVDEAAQCTEPATWVPVLTTPSCKKLVLVGDQKQLPAVILSEEARKNGLKVSLMEKLADEFASSNINVLLKEQFRMNEKIIKWSNEVFYENQLEANEDVKHITLHDICPNLPRDHVINNPILMINMDGNLERTREQSEQQSFTNEDETAVVANYVRGLVVDVGLDAKKVAVIAPYYAQIEQLRKTIECSVDVNTVDSFQGQEREVVVFCLVRDNKDGLIGFLRETRRLNVAVTRAKRQFVLIGSANMLKKHRDLKKLLDILQEENVVFGPEILDSFETVGIPASFSYF